MLTRSQIDQFHELGYVTIEPLFTPAEINAACHAISRVIREKLVYLEVETAVKADPAVVADPELGVRKIMTFTGVDQTLRQLSEHPVLVGAMEQLLGEPCELSQDMALLKPPHIGREKPWHQDNAYFLWSPPEKVIGSWIALDEATIANGCMQVIPGTHRQGPVPHYHIRDCQIPDARVAVDRKVPIPLQPGGCLIFAGLLHHGTEENTSSARRRALQFHYRGRSCKLIEPHEHGRLFNEEHRYAGCALWAREKLAEIIVT